MTEAVLDHLWQSTLFVVAVAAIHAAFREQGARIRYWLWFSASVKFLVPFAAVAALGSVVLTPLAPHLSAPPLEMMRPAAQPFARAAAPAFAALTAPVPATVTTPAAAPLWPLILLTLWFAGFAVITLRWLVRWNRLRVLVRGAVDLGVTAPLRVKVTPSALEPGLVGIWRPVILLPHGIAEHLSTDELGAILDHELCHARRRDNLTAAIHMGVEALFWFYPLIWWLGGRLNMERERACDESVLAAGTLPDLYVDSILKVCRFYTRSPIACASGVSGVPGANLKKRVEAILENRIAPRLDGARKLLLAASAALAVAAPLLAGLLNAPPAIAQNEPVPGAAPHPGTEAALRHQIEAWENQTPDTTNMAPQLATETMLDRPDLQRSINAWGALKSITFKETGLRWMGAAGTSGPLDWDFYTVQFENSQSVWGIAPLGQNGRIEGIIFVKTFQRDGTGSASPGTQAALRRIVEGLHLGKLPYDIMTPEMTSSLTTPGAVEDVQALVHFMQADADVLGAPKTFAFQNVDYRGLDVYAVTYEHGHVDWAIGPLTDGKVSSLVNLQTYFDAKPDPNTEASLRRYIASLESGHPDYAAMAPDLAGVARMQAPQTLASIKSLGALQSMAFTGRGAWNTDIYAATFEYGKASFSIALNASGKIDRYDWQTTR